MTAAEIAAEFRQRLADQPEYRVQLVDELGLTGVRIFCHRGKARAWTLVHPFEVEPESTDHVLRLKLAALDLEFAEHAVSPPVP